MTQYIVSAGQTSSGIVLNSGDQETVVAGGTSIQTTINGGGVEFVASAGLASATTVNGGGLLQIGSSATAEGTFVLSGGFMTVAAGGSVVDTTLQAGPGPQSVVNVMSGAIATATTISSGGDLEVAGSAQSVLVLAGGILDINGGGAVTGQVLRGSGTAGPADSFENIQSGAIAFNISASNGAQVADFGSAQDVFLFSGASLFVESGGVASHTVLQDNGPYTNGLDVSETVFAGGLIENTSLGSGTLLSLQGGNATTISALNGAVVEVNSGSTATNVLLDGVISTTQFGRQGAFLDVTSGGLVQNLSAISGASFQVLGGSATNLTVQGGSELSVYQQGSVSGVVLSGVMVISGLGTQDSFEFVSGGGVTVSTTVLSGATLEYNRSVSV